MNSVDNSKHVVVNCCATPEQLSLTATTRSRRPAEAVPWPLELAAMNNAQTFRMTLHLRLCWSIVNLFSVCEPFCNKTNCYEPISLWMMKRFIKMNISFVSEPFLKETLLLAWLTRLWSWTVFYLWTLFWQSLHNCEPVYELIFLQSFCTRDLNFWTHFVIYEPIVMNRFPNVVCAGALRQVCGCIAGMTQFNSSRGSSTNYQCNGNLLLFAITAAT